MIKNDEVYYLEKGTNNKGYTHIFEYVKRNETMTRFQQIKNAGVVSNQDELIELAFDIVSKESDFKRILQGTNGLYEISVIAGTNEGSIGSIITILIKSQ